MARVGGPGVPGSWEVPADSGTFSSTRVVHPARTAFPQAPSLMPSKPHLSSVFGCEAHLLSLRAAAVLAGPEPESAHNTDPGLDTLGHRGTSVPFLGRGEGGTESAPLEAHCASFADLLWACSWGVVATA